MSHAPVAKHHYVAAKKGEERLRGEKSVIAVLMAGSVARGVARSDSDVDLIAVVADTEWPEYVEQGRFAFLWRDLVDYPDGYVEESMCRVPMFWKQQNVAANQRDIPLRRFIRCIRAIL